MGILENLKRTIPQAAPPSSAFTSQQALMTIVLGAVKADGEISQEEASRVRAMCSLSPLFAPNTSDEDDAVINFADEVTSRIGLDAISKAAETLSPGLRETAFSFACDMILADGELSESEIEFINWLGGLLGISQETGDLVVEATLIRNRVG